MLFYCYNKCSTCLKAQKWLDEHGLSYDKRDIKEENPSLAELEAFHQASGLPLKKFFQHQRPALPQPGPVQKAAGDDRSRAVCPAGLGRPAGQAAPAGPGRRPGAGGLPGGRLGRGPGGLRP